MPNIANMAAGSGRRIKEDDTIVNVADIIEAIYNALVNTPSASVQLSGSNIADADSVPVHMTTHASVQLSGSNALGAVAVTPSDVADLATVPTKGLYLGGAGNVKVDMADGTTVTFTALSSGMIHPISCKRVYATGTTATSILAVY